MSTLSVQSLVDALPLPAVLIGADSRVQAINALAHGLLGPGIVGRHYMTILRQPAVLEAVERTTRTGGRQETRFLSNDGGNDTTYQVHMAPVAGHGDSRAVMVSFVDITHLEQASQIRRDFVANVSHELRSPLTALMSFIETLRGPAKGDEVAIERFLGIMQNEALRMERLVRDLLSLSRVEAEQRMRPSSIIDLGSVARSVIHAIGPIAVEANTPLHFKAPEARIDMRGDADQLRQVLTNLIENAIKYGPSPKGIEVELSRMEHDPGLRGPAAILTVRDHGAGIDPVHIPRLTERFYRADDHRSREKGGTGLGLAIVKHIINRHRGRLQIKSDLGKGSEFQVVLPL